jgi:predicted small lipoprotein YifL
MMQHVSRNALAAVFLAAVATSGCGLKGALTLPSKSDEVVIRAPGQATPAEGETTATPSATAPAEPAQETPARPRDERIPPPPLPGGKPGTARGG